MGCGLMFDHATGIVIGETVMLRMTCFLSWRDITGDERGDRHPKIGAILSLAPTRLCCNIHIGEGSKMALRVVLQDIPAGVTVAGVPGKVMS